MARVLMVTRPLECPAELCRFLDTVTELSLENTVRICLLSVHARLQRECKRREIDVHVVPRRGMLDIACLVHLHQLMSSGIADEIHIWDGAVQLESLNAARLSARPVTVYEHARRKFGFRDLASHAISQGCRMVAMSDCPSVPSVCRLAVGSCNDDWKLRQGIPKDAFIAGVSSQLATGMGLKDAIWAVDLIKNVRDDLHLVILGDGKLAWRLRRFAKQCRVEERVHFADENVGIADFVASIDCLWFPGHRRSDLRVLEYCMYQGVPIVASNLAAHRKVISHDQTGLIYPVGARRGLAGQTYRLLKSPELMERLGAKAREKVIADAESQRSQRINEEPTAASRVA